MDPAEEALNALVQANLGTWEKQETTPKGGHPARVFVLCTTHDTTDRTPLVGEDDDQGAHAITADTTPGTQQNSNVSEGSVGSVMRQADTKDTGTTGEEGSGLCQAQEDVSGGSVGQGPRSDEVEEGFIE